MLLTLSAKSIWSPTGERGSGMSPTDIPRWAREDLGVHGLAWQTSLMAGWEASQFDKLRDQSDKAGAPCLLLLEDQPLAIADRDSAKADAAVDRAERVLRVAHRLGCSSVAISLMDPGDTTIESITPRLKSVLSRAERLELNLLLSPAKGLTESPEKLTALIRKVGGFRIGSYPDFQTASQSPDPISYLRGLSPYASAVCASVSAFDAKGAHKGYDLKAYIDAILSVGYEASVVLEFRGKGDAIASLRAAKALIDHSLSDTSDEVVPLDEDEEEGEP